VHRGVALVDRWLRCDGVHDGVHDSAHDSAHALDREDARGDRGQRSGNRLFLW
jgi:hypothetical protein